MKAAMEGCGTTDAQLYPGHDLRRGHAIDLQESGAPLWQILAPGSGNRRHFCSTSIYANWKPIWWCRRPATSQRMSLMSEYCDQHRISDSAQHLCRRVAMGLGPQYNCSALGGLWLWVWPTCASQAGIALPAQGALHPLPKAGPVGGSEVRTNFVIGTPIPCEQAQSLSDHDTSRMLKVMCSMLLQLCSPVFGTCHDIFLVSSLTPSCISRMSGFGSLTRFTDVSMWGLCWHA